MTDRTCSVNDCLRGGKLARGMCPSHYMAWRRAIGNDIGPPPSAFRPPTLVRPCSISGCLDPHEARGWCRRHYQRWQSTGDPLGVRDRSAPRPAARGPRARAPIADRFWEKVDKEGALPTHRPDLGQCWVWVGAINASGYGIIATSNRKCRTVHRLSWELAGRGLVAGLHLDHLCRVRHCVRPAHLDQVSCAENVRRGFGNGSKTHCPRGHEYSDENTYRWPNAPHSSRQCRACGRGRGSRA